jgi:hypothetical protein
MKQYCVVNKDLDIYVSKEWDKLDKRMAYAGATGFSTQAARFISKAEAMFALNIVREHELNNNLQGYSWLDRATITTTEEAGL